MGRPARVIRRPPEPTFDAAERWEVGSGDGAALYVPGGRTTRRTRIADFSEGGRIPSELAHDRALVAAQAPAMYVSLLDILSRAREDGALTESEGRPHEGHGPPCDCGFCGGLVALALAEGGGRCIVCGCTDDDACADGCGWADDAHLLCTGHPEPVLKKAVQFLARGCRRA